MHLVVSGATDGKDDKLGSITVDLDTSGCVVQHVTVKSSLLEGHGHAFRVSFTCDSFPLKTPEELAAIDAADEATMATEEALRLGAASDLAKEAAEAAIAHKEGASKLAEGVAATARAMSADASVKGAEQLMATAAAMKAREIASRAAGEAEASSAAAIRAALEMTKTAETVAQDLTMAFCRTVAAVRTVKVEAEKANLASMVATAAATAASAADATLASVEAAARRLLLISGIQVMDLPDADSHIGGGYSDPYVSFSLYADGGKCVATVRTSTMPNANDASWPDTLKIELPGHFTTGKLRATVWDDDSFDDGGNADDALGSLGPVRVGPTGRVVVERATVRANKNARTHYSFQLSFACDGFGPGYGSASSRAAKEAADDLAAVKEVEAVALAKAASAAKEAAAAARAAKEKEEAALKSEGEALTAVAAVEAVAVKAAAEAVTAVDSVACETRAARIAVAVVRAKIEALAAVVNAAEDDSADNYADLLRHEGTLPRALAASPPVAATPAPRWCDEETAVAAPPSRLSKLAAPRHDIRQILAATTKPPYRPSTAPPAVMRYGREGRPRLSDPSHVGDCGMARSVDPSSLGYPVVVTSPRLSPRYRVPFFVPPSSLGSRPTGSLPVRSSRSSRLRGPRPVYETVFGEQVYDAAYRHDVAWLHVLTARVNKCKQTATDLDFAGSSFRCAPLHIAVRHRQPSAVRALLAAGAFFLARLAHHGKSIIRVLTL